MDAFLFSDSNIVHILPFSFHCILYISLCYPFNKIASSTKSCVQSISASPQLLLLLLLLLWHICTLFHWSVITGYSCENIVVPVRSDIIPCFYCMHFPLFLSIFHFSLDFLADPKSRKTREAYRGLPCPFQNWI